MFISTWFEVAVDSTGSVYVSGVVSGTLDDQMYTAGTASSTDIVLLKYNSSGSWQWTRLRGSTGSDFGYAGEKIDFCYFNPFYEIIYRALGLHSRSGY